MTGFDPSEMRVIVSVPQYKRAEIGKKPEVMVELPTLNRYIKAASTKGSTACRCATHVRGTIYLPANEEAIIRYVRARPFRGGQGKEIDGSSQRGIAP